MKDNIRLASIGDCCIDTYPQQRKEFAGGTAFNVAVQGRKAGAQTSIFSAVGTDAQARVFMDLCKKHEVDTSYLLVLNGQTSHVDVHVGQMGEPVFSNWELGVLKQYQLSPSDNEFLHSFQIARIVLFKPLEDLFKQFCKLTLPHTIKVADFAGTSMYSDGVKIIEHYIKDLDIVCKSVDEQDIGAIENLKQLAVTNKDKIVLALRGRNGSMVFRNDHVWEQPAIITPVVDTNGAGDAYVAHFLVNYATSSDIPQSMRAGARAASEVIGKFAAT